MLFIWGVLFVLCQRLCKPSFSPGGGVLEHCMTVMLRTNLSYRSRRMRYCIMVSMAELRAIIQGQWDTKHGHTNHVTSYQFSLTFLGGRGRKWCHMLFLLCSDRIGGARLAKGLPSWRKEGPGACKLRGITFIAQWHFLYVLYNIIDLRLLVAVAIITDV